MTVAGCIPVLMEAWEIGAAKVSTIVSGFYFAYAFSLLGFSWLAGVIGAKRAVTLSAWATALSCGAFALFARDYTSSLILYSLIGLCQGGVYTPIIILFRENVPRERLGGAIGALIASTSVGYAASIGVTGFSLGLSGWQTAFLITGAVPAAGMILLLLAISSLPNVIHQRAPDMRIWRQLRANRSARNLLLGYTSHNWELIGMWTWAPALIATSFVISGEGTLRASQSSAYIITALHLVGAFAAYSMGRLSDRIGRRTVLIWAAAIATGFSFGIGWLVVFTPYLIAALVILYSFFALGDSPVLSTAMAERVEPGALGAMLAARSLAGFISGAVAPLVFGGVVDLLHAAQASESIVWGAAFATLGLGGLLAVWFAARLPERA
jgi:MFS family permease